MAKKGKYEKTRTSAAHKAVRKSNVKTARGGRGGIAALIVGLVLILAAFGGLYAWGVMLVKGDTIYPNVRIAGVEVGGLTLAAARGEVEQAVADAYASNTLEVRLPDQTLAFDPEQTNVALDGEAAMAEALAYGRSDGPIKAVLNYVSSKNRPHNVELETALELDTEYIRTLIAQTAKNTRQEARNSRAEVSTDGKTIVVTKGMPGRFLDEEGLYEAVYSAFQSGDFTPLEWDYVEIPYVEAELAQYHSALTTEVQDARYDEEAHEILEGVSGFQFDLEAARDRLAAAEYGSQMTILLEEIKPELDAETLNARMFGDKLESRSSPYVNNANRTENLRLACEAINGTIINPGEVFSFNDTVGERTAEKGYKPATIYGGDGESVDGVGGGICQVASTIYYTTLYMDLEQVMREPHMYQVTYVPLGMDATVYWDSGLDYKFRNNRENPIKIQANVDGGYVNITFWGVKENDNYVEMTNKVLETFTSDDVEEVDETQPVGYRALKQSAYTGAKVEAYQKVYDGNGKLLKEKTITSTYKSRPNIYVVGPAAPELPDPETPWPEDPELPWPDEDYWP